MKPASLAKAQGAWFLATGIWPLVHMPSFLAVTGPKKDLWLVRTVGALVTCISAQLLISSRQSDLSSHVRPLAAGTAAALAAVDVTYVAKRRISPVYLLDAAVETGLAALWLSAVTKAHEDRKAGTFRH